MQEALRGKHRPPAVEVTFDRLEGRALHRGTPCCRHHQGLREESDEELRFHPEHDRWPAEMNCGCLQKPKNHHRGRNSKSPHRPIHRPRHSAKNLQNGPDMVLQTQEAFQISGQSIRSVDRFCTNSVKSLGNGGRCLVIRYCQFCREIHLR
jgi:hypothetical protein